MTLMAYNCNFKVPRKDKLIKVTDQQTVASTTKFF